MSISTITKSKNPNSIKALALDLDGTTLAPGGLLSERSIRTIDKCMQRGLKVIIATGRAPQAAEKYRTALGVEGPMIYLNGALVVDKPGSRTLFSTLLDIKAMEFCVDLSRELGIYYQVFFPGDGDDSQVKIMTERDRPEREMYHSKTGMSIKIADLKEVFYKSDVKGCLKSMFIGEPERLVMLRRRLEEHFSGSVNIVQSMDNFLEIMNSRASKGQALCFVMELLSLKNEEVIAFGDEENDLPMFAVAGFSVAPSSAKDTVKAKADFVTGSNAEDGVAAFLEEFFIL